MAMEMALPSAVDGLLDVGSPRGVVAWTPVQFACALGDQEMLSQLLKDGAALATGKTKHGYSPLHIAVKYKHESIIKSLLAAKASLSAADTQIGATPLHVAVLQGNLAIVKLLLEANAPQLPTKNGTTPIDLARQLGHNDIAQLLIDEQTRTQGRAQLGEWLAAIGLMEYIDQFVASGFDDLPFLAVHGLSDAALDAMKIDRTGHRLKLQQLYRLSEFLPSTDSSEEEESGSEEEESESEEEEEA